MDASPFARLSAELRNQIWSLVVKEEGPYNIDAEDALEPAITQVCKQIRPESQLMFYADNDFAALIISGDLKDLRRWLAILGPTRAEVVRCLIVVNYNGPYSYNELATGLIWTLRDFNGPKRMVVETPIPWEGTQVIEYVKEYNWYRRIKESTIPRRKKR